jgi:uncharacterized protein (TIGR03435 family)
MRITVPWFAIVILAGTVSVFTQAQTPGSGPRFDVVSIKRHIQTPGPLGFNSTQNQRPDGGFTMTNIRTAMLIYRAYPEASGAEAVGMPGWATSETYDVSATSTLTHATPEDRATMLRAMLADRFKLVAHIEPREQSVFDLVLAREDGKLGAGLTKTDVDCAAIYAERAADLARRGGTPAPSPQMPDFKAPPPPCLLRTVGAVMRDRLGDGQGRAGDLMEGETTMENLALGLRMSSGRIVIDKTGLLGTYRVRMNFESRPPRLGPDTTVAPDAADATPSVFTAVREQLGLKLESSKSQRDTLIIDRLERPTEN